MKKSNKPESKARIEQARIEQVRKGGLPPLATDLSCRDTAGVNHPSLLVHFKLHFEIAFPSSKGTLRHTWQMQKPQSEAE